MVMGRDSHLEGCGFKSQHCILDGHFFTYICCINCDDVCLNRPKVNKKEAGVGPFKKTKMTIELFPLDHRMSKYPIKYTQVLSHLMVPICVKCNLI